MDDEGLAVDVDAPVCSSCRNFASMHTIFVSVLLGNEAERESARDSMPSERGWAQNGGEGRVGDLRVRRTSTTCTLEEAGRGRFVDLTHHAATLLALPKPRVEHGLIRVGDDELASAEGFVIGAREGFVRVLGSRSYVMRKLPSV